MSFSAAKPLRVVLLGPPASGKGTHGRRLAASLGLDYLSTGAVLREQVEHGTELGRIAEPILARGGYLPDDVMYPIFRDWLSRQSGGWVLDGFPRSLPQAKFVDSQLSVLNWKLDVAISLEVPFSDLLARIRGRVECPACRWSGQKHQLVHTTECPKCGHPAGPRADDGEENFRSRYAEFCSVTQPVVAHYLAMSLLCPCDATPPQDEVAARLLELVHARTA